MEKVYTVSELTKDIRLRLETRYEKVWVEGEISNLSRPISGHIYFTLKDANAQIGAVIFKGSSSILKFELKDGLRVLTSGGITVYEKQGKYQIRVTEIQPKGIGALQLAFEQLKEKLSKDGLFDDAHKKPIPVLPQKIGVVTSPTGAAIKDFLNIIGRRFSNLEIYIYPVKVQGDEAAGEIARAIDELNASKLIDVIIITRGGGSLEDLWAFNEEVVARAIFRSEIPVISAVGHEIDFTISDFTADLRVPTPSAAAELVVREKAAISDEIQSLKGRLTEAMERLTYNLRHQIMLRRKSFAFAEPKRIAEQKKFRLDDMSVRMHSTITSTTSVLRANLQRAGDAILHLSPKDKLSHGLKSIYNNAKLLKKSLETLIISSKERFTTLTSKLDVLSPLSVLSRGYSLTRKLPERTIVSSFQQVVSGDNVEIMLKIGEITAKVTKIQENRSGKDCK